ncbi:MAG: DUF4235 domain-containing protein [Thermoleophilaceae bacterium]
MKFVYKPLGLLFGVLGGLLGGAVFKQIWKRIADEDEVPSPTDSDYGWREVLPAAALEGAIFALVRASINRGGAVAFRRMTGVWPGD